MKAVAVLCFVLCTSAFSFELYDRLDAEADYEGRFWWAPSRKAPLYSHKYHSLVESASKKANAKSEGFRLPGDLEPTLYTLLLTPVLEPGNFTTIGQVIITMTCKTDTNAIVLNAADLLIDFTSVEVWDVAMGASLRVTSTNDEQESREMITFRISPPGLKAGQNYRITINFVSFLNDELRGLYRSSYEQDGEIKYLAISQFEAPDARRAFPCFDEPNMKANFSISIRRKSTMTSVSNMPQSRRPISDPTMPGYFWDSYTTSVKMPTYLVAMMVSEFVRTPSDESLSPGVSFGVICRPGYEHQTRYAGNIGPRILEYYSKTFFGIDFPLPKVDMAAIPDFAAGAMENWGLITYREADLLYETGRSSNSARQRVAVIIAHELAHQWFGNLVTMDWWNVLWLNEGFASWMEYIGTDEVEKGFEMDNQFTVNDLHYVFGVDSLESSRPINFEVNTPAQINQMFDAISYEKGASILRMCASMIGFDTFRRGITRYLNTNAFGNTKPDDLWDALQTQVIIDRVFIPYGVKTIMDSWTNKMGYPVVTVIRDYANGKAEVSQQRFLLRKSDSSNDITDYLWHIPLTYTSNFAEPTKTNWLPVNANSTLIAALGVNSGQWVIFNVGQVGYYRVLYDDTNLALILEQLMKDHDAISLSNRAQLMDDYLNLARAGMTPYSNALNVTKALANERDYVPWAAASTALEYVDQMLYTHSGYGDWKRYMMVLIRGLYDHVGFNPFPRDTHMTVFARSLAVSWACTKLEMSECVGSAKQLYSSWMSSNDDRMISPNLRWLVSCTAVAYGGPDEYTFVYIKYGETALGNEKNEYLRAMSCTRNEIIIQNLLNLIITPGSAIRLQDANRLFNYIAANPVGHEIALNFVTNRWDDIYNYFSGFDGFGGGGSLPGFVRALCNRVNTPRLLERIEKLVEDHADVLGSVRSVQQGLELARSNVKWVDDYHDEVIAWIKVQSPAETTTTSARTTATSETTRSSTATRPTTASTMTSAASNTMSASSSTGSTVTTRATTPKPSSAGKSRLSIASVLAGLLGAWTITHWF